MLQIPADVLTERDGPGLQAGLVAVQAAWAVGLLFARLPATTDLDA